MSSVDKKAAIYFSLGGEFQKYIRPFLISEKATLAVYAQKEGIKSAVITTDFYKIDPNLKIVLKTSYANQYNAGGDHALIDGVLGTKDFRTGTWQGYFDSDVVAVVDLGSKKTLKKYLLDFYKINGAGFFIQQRSTALCPMTGLIFKHILMGVEL